MSLERRFFPYAKFSLLVSRDRSWILLRGRMKYATTKVVVHSSRDCSLVNESLIVKLVSELDS
jgi:hypothetical protein